MVKGKGFREYTVVMGLNWASKKRLVQIDMF